MVLTERMSCKRQYSQEYFQNIENISQNFGVLSPQAQFLECYYLYDAYGENIV